MSKHVFFLLLFLIGKSLLIASPLDSIRTTYQNGEFITHCRVYVNAADSTSYSVLKDFEYQMRYNLDGLFGWALKGLNLRKEKNELMIFHFKSTAYSPETRMLRGVGDVIVPGYITIPDITIDSRLTSKKYTNGKSSFSLDLISSNGFMKDMHNTFSVIPAKGHGMWYTLDARVKFGWFFDIFITKKRYKSIMEWRLRRFVHNIKEETERRQRPIVPVQGQKIVEIPDLTDKNLQ